MFYHHLVIAQLGRRKLRTLFTALSILVAFLLFGVLLAVADVFTREVELAGVDRLITVHKNSIINPLPQRYGERIGQVEGVEKITHASWFGGNYQDPKNFFPKFPVGDIQTYLEIYPEFIVPPEQLEALQRTRTGALAGRKLVERFGWKIGDRIPIEADIWPKEGGDRLWEFDLVGIFDGAEPINDTGFMMFRYDYFDEARAYAKGEIGWFVIKVADPDNAEQIARQIDRMFANSAAETKTSSEEEFTKSFAKQWGDIGAIVRGVMGAVFFTLLLVVGNAIAQSVRERTRELAVLKTLGFSGRRVAALVLLEALALTLVPALAGLLVAQVAVGGLSVALQAFLPTLLMPVQTWLFGLGFAVLLALVAAAPPAYGAMRLEIARALGRE